MKYFIPIIILSLFLIGCKADEDDSTSSKTDAALEGTWKTACYTNSDNTSTIDTPTFSGSTLTLTDEKHSDASCATDYRLKVETHKYELEEKGKLIVTLGSTIKRTAQSSSAVSSYNTSNKCGHSDWALNTAKDCTDSSGGDKVYCLYEVSGSTLYVDCADSSYPTSNTKTAGNTFTKQ